jgi:predicted RNA-binding protein YlqC (UPF0109 family)
MDRLITTIAQCLVDRPENVAVKSVHSDHTTVLELRGAKDDIGKIIGKQGRNINAIRTLMGAAATKMRKHTILELVE